MADEAPALRWKRWLQAGRRAWLRRVGWLLVLPCLLLMLFGCERAASSGSVMRGVSLGSVSLSGLTKAAAKTELQRLRERLMRRPLHVSVAGKLFRIRPEQLGVSIDVDATVDRALAAGREGGLFGQLGWWLQSFERSTRLGFVVKLDEKLLEQRLVEWEREAITAPPFPGGLKLEGGKLAADYPRSGQVVDRGRAAEVLRTAFGAGQLGVVPLVEKRPPLERAAVDAALLEGQKLVSQSVLLRNEEEDVEVIFTSEELRKALTTKPEAGKLAVSFDEAVIKEKLKPLRERLEVQPKSAQFIVERGDEIRVEPSQNGTLIELDKVAAELLTAGRAGAGRGTLHIRRSAAAEFTTEQAEALGIKKLLASFTTYHPCCKPRVKNIHRIAKMLDGVIVRPGERFSVNELVGPRTQAKGFVLAPTIVRGKMKDSLGGGISQFATTLFNAIFDAGLEVVQRQPHSYWFARYPEGIEATLSFPLPDLIFVNDTKAGVLVKTEFGGKFIRVKLFGDNEGRKVRRIVSRRFDYVDPPIVYEADETMDPEKEKVLNGGRKGWSVVATRVVTYPDGKKKEETRKVIYNPRERIVRLHPCRIPEGDENYTGEECPEPEEDAGADGGEGEGGEDGEDSEDPSPQGDDSEPEQEPEDGPDDESPAEPD